MNNKRKNYTWLCRERTLLLGERSLIMGILNVTPDSFSDGGNYSDPSAAVAHALKMVSQGADIIDVGGESTRPGSSPVSIKEEIRRTIPVIEKIREQSDVFISIDTTKAEVARLAIMAGADIINDISALHADPNMAHVLASTKAGGILMHMQGSPKTMQKNPSYDHIINDVSNHLQSQVDFAISHGVKKHQIVIDPGIGFGKTLDHNLKLLRNLPTLATQLNAPILVGASRKSFIGQLLEKTSPTERLAGNLGIAAWLIMQGTHILRVHDVFDTCDVCKLMDTLLAGE